MNVLSLFSGVGGFDLGLERAGLQTVFQCESDPDCLTILNRHWPFVPKHGDIQTLTGAAVLAACRQIDVVVWGSPCQDLSIAGSKKGLDGEKSSLFFEGIRIIKELREATNGRYPRFIVWENVPSALSTNEGKDFRRVLEAVVDAGSLVTEWAVLDARYFGVPQRRRRVFLVGVLDPDVASRCPEEILSVRHGMYRYSPKSRKAGATTLTSTYPCLADGGEYAYTLTANVYHRYSVNNQDIDNNLLVIDSPESVRKLTPLECERLMGWPDAWTLCDSDERRYKQIGNGVVAPVAAWVGRRIRMLDLALPMSNNHVALPMSSASDVKSL